MLSQVFKKRWHKKMLSGVETVKVGLLDLLAERYQPTYGKETADLLAAAVVNELFFHKPTYFAYIEFAELYKDTVKKEIYNLLQDKELSPVLCQAVHVQVQVAKEQGALDLQAIRESFQRLKESGMPSVDAETITPQAFLHMAREFCQNRT